MSYINQEEHDFLQGCEVVVVIGMPASGKTTVAAWLQDVPLMGHSLFSSDDYIDHGYEQSLYAMIRAMKDDTNKKQIVEGVQGFRFLRKNAETKEFKVDAVIMVHCGPAERARRYEARGKGQLPTPFERNLQTVFGGYMAKMKDSGQDLPRFIDVTT